MNFGEGVSCQNFGNRKSLHPRYHDITGLLRSNENERSSRGAADIVVQPGGTTRELVAAVAAPLVITEAHIMRRR